MDSYRVAVYQSGGRRAGDDEEIGVFTAERYFSAGDIDDVPWCGRSSSSYSSTFKTSGPQDWSAAPTTLTAATSSSEASSNSRFVLLLDPPVAAAAAAAQSEEPSGAAGDRTPGTKRSSSLSSHNLLRWLLGVAACARARGGIEEGASADECPRDEAHAAGFVPTKRGTEEADATLPGRKSKHGAAEVTTRRVRSGVSDGSDADAFDTGTDTPPPLHLGKPQPIRAADSSEQSLSARVLNPRTAVLADEWRRSSMGVFASARQQNSAFTIFAGSAAAPDGDAAAGGTGGYAGRPIPSPNGACAKRRDSGDDDAAIDELDGMYPPSEASVVWSVVTADGAASGNFSSAASGHYHHYYYHNGGGDDQRTVAEKNNRRSSGSSRANGASLLMGCMSERAVDTIGSARPVHPTPPPEARAARLEVAPTWHAGRR
ncbi:hypothetical protein GUJ93_ZPchr0010g7314 [Zizania palustris]|uniref:Uncharacterized protein n=1 Tax=Zizania palustris TaxID=103762 RepID=A0A8J5W7W5_ZIZPA|nr:hypothetical protein GUJ93_ZPchr0010g7314 [Zizania palustris]